VGGVMAVASVAQATVISLGSDGTYTTEAKLDFRQQRKTDMEKLILEIPVTRVPAAPAKSSKAQPFELYILSMGEKFENLNPDIIQAVIKIESNFDANAISSKGAQGLMQLMPATAKRHGITDAFDPEQNIQAGSSELSRLLTVYDSLPLALAAYNAGEGAVTKYGGIPPYPETRNYVVKVLTEILKIQKNKISILSAINMPDSYP